MHDEYERRDQQSFGWWEFGLGALLALALLGGLGFVFFQRRVVSAQQLAMMERDRAVAAEMQARMAAEVAAAKVLQPQADSDEAKVIALGDGIVEDLRLGRSLAVHRLGTKAFIEKEPGDKFEQRVKTVGGLVQLSTAKDRRSVKVRKSANDGGWEYYCTAETNNFGPMINVAVTFVKEGDDWRVAEIEIK